MTDRTAKIRDHESPQVGTHGSSPEHDTTATHESGWQDRSDERAEQPDPLQRELQRGSQTKEQQPSGSMPLERDERPINQQR